MTTTTSRRAILAGAATLPALTVSALALTPVSHAGVTDAELLALRPKLESVIADYVSKFVAAEKHRDLWEAACTRAGLPRREHKDFPGYGEFAAYNRARCQIDAGDGYVDETDEHGASIAWTSLNERMFDVCDRIAEIQPCTIEGLGVRARAYSFSRLCEIWDGDADDIEQLIDPLCAFCGVRPVYAEVEAALTAPFPNEAKT
jgi:hypothetical protein